MNKLCSQDTLYFDKSWKKSDKTKASYFRIIKKNNSEYFATDYFIDGKIQMTGVYSSIEENIKNGPFKYYSEKGFLTSEGNYLNNKKEGLWNGYYKDTSVIRYNQIYKNDKLDGEQIYFYLNGNIKRKDSAVEGEIKAGKCFTFSGKDTTYFAFQKLPKFVGGEQEMMTYIQKNVVYPKKSLNKEIQGTVYVQFTVEKDGSINEAEIAKGVESLIDAEALRVVKSMPLWIPGKEDGEKVRVKYSLPIKFTLYNK